MTGRGNTASVETVLAARPDVILDYGTINPTYVSLAERIQKQTGVPYLLFDGAFDQIAAMFKAAGAALAVNERAGQLSRYAERMLRGCRQTPGASTGAEAAVGLLRAWTARHRDRSQGFAQCRKHRAYWRAQRRRASVSVREVLFPCRRSNC